MVSTQTQSAEANVSRTQPMPAVKPGHNGHAAPVPAELVIQARGLTKKFNDEAAVLDLNLDVPRGAIFGLIGPSGCGKTTTVRLMTGVLRPSAGQVSVLGTSPGHFSSTT